MKRRASELLMFVAVVALRTEGAKACAIAAPPPALDGRPAEGDIGIPTDVVPLYVASSARLYQPTAANVTVDLTSSSGETVAATLLTDHSDALEIKPSHTLAPLTTYRLHLVAQADKVNPARDLSLSFTTGAGPLANGPSASTASVENYVYDDFGGTDCDPAPRGTCLALAAGTAVELVYLNSFDNDNPEGPPYIIRNPYFLDLTPMNGSGFDCVRLRTRAINGTYSAPTDVCGHSAQEFHLTGSRNLQCTSAGLVLDGKKLAAPESSSGCSMASPSARTGWMPLLLTAAGWLVGLRRRRRRARCLSRRA